jgi:hypothetical protein
MEEQIPKKKNRHAQALAKLGASKGGHARAKNLTPEERSEQAHNASVVRWEKYRKEHAQAKES